MALTSPASAFIPSWRLPVCPGIGRCQYSCRRRWGAGEAEQLRFGEEGLDGPVVFAELGAVALVEDEHHALVAQGSQALFVGLLAFFPSVLVALAGFVQRQAQLLDGGDDDLVGVVLGEHAPHQRFGVGVFLHAAFLKAVEFLAGLAVEILAVHHEQHLFHIGVVLEQGRGLERGERLSRSCGVPDVAVAAVLVDAIDDGLDRVNLIGPHHEDFLLAFHQHHVAADHFAEGAFVQEGVGEIIQMGDLFVVFRRQLIDGQKALIGVEGEVFVAVVGEVPGLCSVADDEQLHETQQRVGVAVAGVVFVIDDLLHGPARADLQGFQLDLHQRQAIDQQDYVIALETVVGFDAQLVDHLELVFAPVIEIDQLVMQRRAIFPLEAVDLPQSFGGVKDIGVDDLVAQAGEFGIGEADSVERLELVAEVLLQSGAVADVGAEAVFKVGELAY